MSKQRIDGNPFSYPAPGGGGLARLLCPLQP